MTLTERMAVRQAVNFALDHSDAFRVYDVAGMVARRDGRFGDVGPWTFLLAGAIGGWATFRDLNGSLEHLERFALLVRAIPPNSDLHQLTDTEREAVKALCSFRVPNIRAAKVTKVGALFRPRAVPILDKRIAEAFGERTLRGGDAAIGRVVDALVEVVDRNQAALDRVRSEAARYVVDFRDLSSLRLADILIWTSATGGWDSELPRGASPVRLADQVRWYPLLIPAHRAAREAGDKGAATKGRYEVAMDTPVVLDRRPDWAPLERLLREPEPVSVTFEGRRFTWFPGDAECMPVATVPIASSDDYLAERIAMERFLSAVSFLSRRPVMVETTGGAGFKREFDAPILRQPWSMRFVVNVSVALDLPADPDLHLALGLYREAMSSRLSAFQVLGYWKVVEVALNARKDLADWLPDAVSEVRARWELDAGETARTEQEWVKWLRDSRNAAAHGVREWADALTHDPHDPDVAARLRVDASRLETLARKAMCERWPRLAEMAEAR